MVELGREAWNNSDEKEVQRIEKVKLYVIFWMGYTSKSCNTQNHNIDTKNTRGQSREGKKPIEKQRERETKEKQGREKEQVNKKPKRTR